MITIDYKNFKCEDCGEDKFTILDNFNMDISEITLFCSGKDCGAQYSFSPIMKKSSSYHQAKRCKCGIGWLDRNTKFCNDCGKENPNYKEEFITDEDLEDEEDDDEVDELLTNNNCKEEMNKNE